ncbi:MAG: hypothetical protein D6708_02125 [Candidatus Dadabacteria bacterium]|nr:MAG: hypothetical protein D6708_02125 [Candidatus Dadabacteria bacterium]
MVRTAVTLGLIGALAASLAAAGWFVHTRNLITAERGLGYALGVAAAASMGLLLAYPVRKRWRALHGWGVVRHWFLVHILLGVVGPLCALFHANFRVGSANSLFVLSATVLVALSGFVGAFLYTRVHEGLFGALATLESLRRQREESRDGLVFLAGCSSVVRDRLVSFEEEILSPPSGILAAVRRVLFVGVQTRLVRRRIRKEIREAVRRAGEIAGWSWVERWQVEREARRAVARHVKLILRTARLGFHSRLLGLWHLLHLPLFLLMMLAVGLHVVAVHMY